MTKQELQDLISKSKRFGCDYHGTLDSGKFIPPDGTIVITGAPIEEEDRIREEIKALGYLDKVELIYNETDDISDIAVGKFKAKKIKELGIDLFFDNDPAQIYWIKKFNPQANVVYINALNYAIFTYDFECLGYALRLLEEGNSVVIGRLEPEDMGEKVGDPELEKRRKQIGSGLIKVVPAKTLFKFLMSNNEIEDYFVDFDFNYGYKYAEELEKKGYVGLFPHEIDREMEKDRQLAQDFVKKNYPDLFIPEEKEFKDISEAIDYIQESEKLYVIKPNSDKIYTFVPTSEEPDKFIEEAKSFLEENKKELEKEGFIVQEKIIQPVEATPEAIYYKGEPIAFTVDLELKKFGAGDISYQTGCTYDTVFPIDEDCRLVKVGLQPYFETAKERKFSNFMDASMLIDRKNDKPYFGEFCAARRGYNSFYTELTLLPSVSHFFECVKQGLNPFKAKLHPFENDVAKFAVSIRIFNLVEDKDRYPQSDLPIQVDKLLSKYIWLEDAKKVDNKIVTAGYKQDVAIVTGAGNSLKEAIENAIMNVSGLVIRDMYFRNDLDSEEWYSLSNRYTYLLEQKWL